MSEHITLSELKALLNDLPEDRIVNITLTIDAPEYIEAQLSRLRDTTRYQGQEIASLRRENERLRDLLWQIGIEENPDHLNSTRIEELRAAVKGVTAW